MSCNVRIAALVLASMLAASADASADDERSSLLDFHDPEPMAVAVGVILLPFATLDLVRSRPGVAYGLVETLVAGPIAIGYTLRTIGSPDESPALSATMMVVSGALAAHGIYTIVRSARDRRVTATTVVPIATPQGAGAMVSGSF